MTEAAPLDDLLAELRAAGYATDPSQMAAAHHLLLLAAAGAWPGAWDRLGSLLAPVFAQSPLQQADLLHRIERWRCSRAQAPAASARVFQELRAPAMIALVDTPVGQFRPLWRGRWPLWAAETAMAVLVAGFVCTLTWWLERPVTTAPPQVASLPPPYATPSPSVTGFLARSGPVVTARPTAAFYAAGTASPPAWSTPVPPLLGMLPIAVVGIATLAARRRSRRLQRRAAAAPRDMAELSVLAPSAPLFEDVATDLAARDLARPRRLAIDEPDIDRSVDATVREAGRICIVARERSIIPSYVVVIEEAGRHDHLARLADGLASRLMDAGVLAECHHMTGPSLVRGQDGRFESLEDLANRSPDRRLLLIGPGEAVTDQSGRRLTSALRADAQWADRAYLVAGRIDAWTTRLLTKEGFAVSPATPEGLRALGRYIASAPREGGEVLEPLPGIVPRSSPPSSTITAALPQLGETHAAAATIAAPPLATTVAPGERETKVALRPTVEGTVTQTTAAKSVPTTSTASTSPPLIIRSGNVADIPDIPDADRRFARSLDLILQFEGGFSDIPADHGGATNRGITIPDLRRHRGHNVTVDDIRNLADDEVAAIYRENYWSAVRGNQLPKGVDLCAFDGGVLCGPGTSIRFLQTAMGFTGSDVDGRIGFNTVTAAQSGDAHTIIEAYVTKRREFHREIVASNASHAMFLQGWLNRVDQLEKNALSMLYS